ncbi:Sec-independent protein translocase protein TatB [Pseudoalteromonas denitrificans]|uniref:Sec-independent protein translocase protein TatB n=1 Tax=Pseudoalteromonas denitrificans DSM 6059 TaxID=1123010 RepID=A0A1I1MDK8_9GAMM|nr:Sec-independent protein translocase protein TatB [Pseudoalteromonas denitrificans]SFC83531.1 sec-independent protein translocase protein TatB [Pseudoalteromonas denitrificans DSM 6059]
MGAWELVIVFIVGLIVLGPERLPVAIRTVSRWIKTAKQFGQSVQSEINEELRIHELHNNLKQAEEKGMKNLSPEIKNSLDELNNAAQSVTRSYKETDTKESKNDK